MLAAVIDGLTTYLPDRAVACAVGGHTGALLGASLAVLIWLGLSYMAGTTGPEVAAVPGRRPRLVPAVLPEPPAATAREELADVRVCVGAVDVRLARAFGADSGGWYRGIRFFCSGEVFASLSTRY